MPKKILTILSIIIIIFLLILGGLFFVVRTPPSENDSVFTKKIRDIFPFGKQLRDPNTLFEGDGEVVNNQTNEATSTSPTPIPKLRKIHPKPTSGSILWTIENKITKEATTTIRFVDRTTGHVFETTPHNPEITKISNTTLPKMYEAKFLTPDNFIARFLDRDNETIKTYSVTLKNSILKTSTTTATSSLPQKEPLKESVGINFEDNIKEITTSPTKNRLLFSLYDEAGGSLIVSNPNNTNKKKIFESPLREWLLAWGTENEVLLSTKPSGYVNGFVYTLNIQTGVLSKLLGNILGLTIKANRNNNEYLIGSGGEKITLFSFKPNRDNETLFLANTLPEKCVWSKKESFIIYCAIPTITPSGIYPDHWYQGKISFNDGIWKINTNTATTNLISIPQRDGGEDIDVVDLEISDNDTYLTFINKKDLSFWGLRLVEPLIKTTESSTSTSSTSTPKSN